MSLSSFLKSSAGGLFSFLTVLFSNWSVLRRGVSTVVLLGLLGQIISSALVDLFSGFPGARQAFRKDSIPGFLLIGTDIFLIMYF